MSINPYIKATGIPAISREIKQVKKEFDLASLAGYRAVTNTLKRRIRANMGGGPRWNSRGTSKGKYSQSYYIQGMPRHEPRAGGVGILTGELKKGVGAKKPRPNLEGDIFGGVGIGGKRLMMNNYKKRWEKKYPFFYPAVEQTAPEMEAIYGAGFKKVINKYRG